MKSQSQAVALVTGCAGFVGSHLSLALLDKGVGVIGVDNFFSGYARNMDGFKNHPLFTFYERSVTEKNLFGWIKDRHAELTHVFHLAAIVSVPYSVQHPEETMEVNYSASVTIYEQGKESGLRAFVFAGSAAEYGDIDRLPLKEEYADEKTRHLSPYGRAKFLSSRHIEASGLGTALRFFNIYGPRQDPKSPYSGVISRFIDFGIKGMPLTIFGDGRQTRDFIYISDVVRAYLAVAGLGEVGPEPLPGLFNVGSGRSVTVLELAQTVAALTGDRQDPAFEPEREGDIRHSFADVKKLERVAGFKAVVPLKQGLAETIRWARVTLR